MVGVVQLAKEQRKAERKALRDEKRRVQRELAARRAERVARAKIGGSVLCGLVAVLIVVLCRQLHRAILRRGVRLQRGRQPDEHLGGAGGGHLQRGELRVRGQQGRRVLRAQLRLLGEWEPDRD